MPSTMKRPFSISSVPARTETLTIRHAGPEDQPALRRLAQLDSAPPPRAVATLVAEVQGELRAALPVDGGEAIANPFRHTRELVALLEMRARELQAFAQAPRRRPRRSIRALRPMLARSG
jgi:hypothetical protein